MREKVADRQNMQMHGHVIDDGKITDRDQTENG